MCWLLVRFLIRVLRRATQPATPPIVDAVFSLMNTTSAIAGVAIALPVANDTNSSTGATTVLAVAFHGLTKKSGPHGKLKGTR